MDENEVICAILGCVEFAFEKMPHVVLFRGFVNLLGNYMDSIANMLTSILNAQRVGKTRVAIPYSRFKEQLATLLQERGLIATMRVQDGARAQLILTLVYEEETREPRIHGVRRMSTPGRRLYVSHDRVPYPVQSQGAVLVSTSQGLMDDGKARKLGVGGELVCEIW